MEDGKNVNGNKPNYFSKPILRVAIAIVTLSTLSFLVSSYLLKKSWSDDDRINTIVNYVRSKPPFPLDSTATKEQIEITGLMRDLEFKSVKEDYYIQQLNIQSTWIVTIVSILFVIFTILEYSVFERKVEQIQQKQDKESVENQKKIHDFEVKFVEFQDKHDQISKNLHFLMGHTYSASALMYGESKNYLMAADNKLRAILEYLKGLGEHEYTDENLDSLNYHIEKLELTISNANTENQIWETTTAYYEELENIFIDLIKLTRNNDSAKKLQTLSQHWKSRIKLKTT